MIRTVLYFKNNICPSKGSVEKTLCNVPIASSLCDYFGTSAGPKATQKNGFRIRTNTKWKKFKHKKKSSRTFHRASRKSRLDNRGRKDHSAAEPTKKWWFMFFSPFRLSTVQFLFNVFLQKKKRETQKNKCFLWMGKIREYNFLAGAAFFFFGLLCWWKNKIQENNFTLQLFLSRRNFEITKTKSKI